MTHVTNWIHKMRDLYEMLKIIVPSVVRMLNVWTVNFKINKYALFIQI